MPSQLPTTETTTKAVNTYGLGTYDSQRDSDGDHGEDSEKREPEGETLPQEGGPLDPFGPDRLLGYPEHSTSQGKHASRRIADVPGDYDRPPGRRRINDDTLDSVVESVAQAKLPSDEDNPSARSDYYDHMQTGQNIWPNEDSGAYVSQKKKVSESSLPGVSKNEESMDNSLGALGNYWSGYEVEDVSGPQGFPSEDFKENVNYDRSDNQNGGKILASMEKSMRPRVSTDIPRVVELTKEFVKEYGKKDLTRRHVMAFLQDKGCPQYLASDIIRCLKHSYKLVFPDVLDTFPVAKTASVNIASIRNKIIQLQIASIKDPEVANVLGRCAADLTHVLVAIKKDVNFDQHDNPREDESEPQSEEE